MCLKKLIGKFKNKNVTLLSIKLNNLVFRVVAEHRSIFAASSPPYYFHRIPDISTRSCLYITFKEDAEIMFPITPFNTRRRANYSHE